MRLAVLPEPRSAAGLLPRCFTPTVPRHEHDGRRGTPVHDDPSFGEEVRQLLAQLFPDPAASKGGGVMPKEAGLDDRLFCNGFDLSGDIGSIQTIKRSVAEFDATGINKNAKERLQLLADGELSFNSYFTGDASDTNNEHAHERLRNLDTTALVTYFRGTTQGGGGAGLVAKQFSYDLNRAANGGLLGSVQCKAAGGVATEWGRILDAAGTASSTGTNQSTGLDLGASHGIDDMAFHFHVTAFTGTNATVIVQTDDNSGFTTPTTYGSFAVVSAANAYERLAVSGAPERYIRWRVTGTFSAITFVILAVPLYD
ncbi:MAG: hypothetical protein AB7H92_14030 [Microbacteriaceae bacterium]